MKALICTLYKILPSSGGQSIDSTFFVSIVAQYRSCTPELGGLFLLWFCGPGLVRGGGVGWGGGEAAGTGFPSTLGQLPPVVRAGDWWLKSGDRLKSFKHVCIFNMLGTRWHCFICEVYVEENKTKQTKRTSFLSKCLNLKNICNDVNVTFDSSIIQVIWILYSEF